MIIFLFILFDIAINLAKPPRLNNHCIALLALLKGKGRDIPGDYSDTSKHITNTLTEFTETTQTEVVQCTQRTAAGGTKKVDLKIAKGRLHEEALCVLCAHYNEGLWPLVCNSRLSQQVSRVQRQLH